MYAWSMDECRIYWLRYMIHKTKMIQSHFTKSTYE